MAIDSINQTNSLPFDSCMLEQVLINSSVFITFKLYKYNIRKRKITHTARFIKFCIQWNLNVWNEVKSLIWLLKKYTSHSKSPIAPYKSLISSHKVMLMTLKYFLLLLFGAINSIQTFKGKKTIKDKSTWLKFKIYIFSTYETEQHNSSHRLKPKRKAETSSHIDTDYTGFMPGGYNYLDPNYMPARWMFHHGTGYNAFMLVYNLISVVQLLNSMMQTIHCFMLVGFDLHASKRNVLPWNRM